jgi:hypothetical protein
VTAIFTVNEECKHVFLSTGGVLEFAHASILPRIFNSICKNDILACDIKSSIAINIELNSWFTKRVPENGPAIRNPVSLIDKIRSERMLLICHLEPSEFSTVLPGPLAHVIKVIHFDV